MIGLLVSNSRMKAMELEVGPFEGQMPPLSIGGLGLVVKNPNVHLAPDCMVYYFWFFKPRFRSPEDYAAW